jgi:hypothetical protein
LDEEKSKHTSSAGKMVLQQHKYVQSAEAGKKQAKLYTCQERM